MALMQTESKRNANMDLLRMVSMMMVTMLHALTKGDLLLYMGSAIPANGWIAWVFEALSVSAVNVYMLISGYFLISSKFKMGRLLEIILQTLFYSAGPFAIFLILGNYPVEDLSVYELIQYFLPIHMETYWFISAYVIIYLLLPLIISGVHSMSKKQLQGVIWGLLIFECVIKSVFPVRLTMDKCGYSFLWYLTLFLTGAYIKLYGVKLVRTAGRGCFVFLTSTFLILAEIYTVCQIQVRTGRLMEMTTVSLEYNHIFVFSSAIGLFMLFLYAKPMGEKSERLVGRISRYCLGVYLLQENPLIRYLWQDWFGLREIPGLPVPLFVIRLMGAVISMFVLGICVDIIRAGLFFGAKKIMCRGYKD